MDEFDEILRRKLANPDNVPDSQIVWSKVSNAINPGVPKIWKSIALLSFALWLITMASMMFVNNRQDIPETSNTKGKNQEQLIDSEHTKLNTHTSIDNSSNSVIHDTIYKIVHVIKWKELKTKGFGSALKNEKSQINNEIEKPDEKIIDANVQSNAGIDAKASSDNKLSSIDEITTIPYLTSNEPDPVYSQIFLKDEKLKTPKNNKSNSRNFNRQLPAWEIGIYAGKTQFLTYLNQQDDLAPIIKSFRYSVSLRHNIWKGLGVNAGFSYYTADFKAPQIKDIAADKEPFGFQPGGNSSLETLNFNQKISLLNTGISYHNKLKNNWTISGGLGLEWILNGKHENTYSYMEGPYNQNKLASQKIKATPFKVETAYLNLGLDIPIYNNWQLSARFKKHLLINKNYWLVPDISGELGINYYIH